MSGFSFHGFNRLPIPPNPADPATDLTFHGRRLYLLEAIGRAIYDAVNDKKASADLDDDPKGYFSRQGTAQQTDIPAEAVSDIPDILEPFDINVVRDSQVTAGEPGTADFRIISGTLNIILPARTKKLEDMNDPAERILYLRELGFVCFCGCG